MTLKYTVVGAAMVWVAFSGCSNDGQMALDGGTGDAASGTGGSGGAMAGQGGGGTGGSNQIIIGADGGIDESCAESVVESDPLPLDIYVMFDQSGSMLSEDDDGTRRIDAVRGALKDFLADANSDGLGMGIGYFGYQEIGETTCDPEDYETPAVGIGSLPGNESAIRSSLDATEPTGETPTGAAIRGACRYTQGWQQQQTDHVVVNLLVTDGEPKTPVTPDEECGPTLEDAVMAASTCASGTPGIRTYVLGVGSALDNLDQIAAAGDTDEAHLVSSTTDVSAQILAALNQIRGDAVIPCELQLPEPPSGQEFDPEKVNVIHTPAGGSREFLPRVALGECSGEGGWHYDTSDPAAASKIVLCPSSCGDVTSGEGTLDIVLGCATVVLE